MGVDLGKIVPREEIKFDYLKHKSVAIDAFNALYQFLSSIRGYDGNPLMDSKGKVTSHLQGLFSRSFNLMGKGVKLVYVFDGKAPELKFKENEERIGRKILAQEKYEEAASEDDFEAMNKYSKQFVRLNKEMIEDSKELVSALGLPIVQAPSEAEGQVAYMCKSGLVDYASSQDYDSLLFGAPKLIRNLTLSQKRKITGGKTVFTFLELVELDKVLNELGLNQEQLIVLGILTGTDFNVGGVKGIGPKKALKLIKEFNNDFDKMFSSVNAEFDWKEVYEIFSDLPVDKKVKLNWNVIDRERVKKILVDKHEFNAERIDLAIDKYLADNKNSNQKGLGDFF